MNLQQVCENKIIHSHPATMPTHFINMTQNEYPFGESVDYDKNSRILIKQVFYKNQVNLTQFIRIAKLTKKITEIKVFIKLETIVEEDDRVCLFYEYVPIKIQKYIRTMDEQFIKQYRGQLYPIAEILAENAIITNIELTNMGLNDKYEAKYFLGLNFVQKKQVNVYELNNDYLEQIKRIFGKYLPSQMSAVVPKKYTKNLVKLDNRMSDTQEIQNVSSYIDPQNRLVKTRKHQSIYYERSKDQELKKRKQSYMSSVSNLRLNNLYKRINQIQLQVCKSSKNNFKMSIEGRQFTSKSSLGNPNQALQAHNRLRGASKHNNQSLMNSTSNYAPQYKHSKNSIKYPGYENDEDDYNDQSSQIQQYQRSIRSNKPNRYAIKNNPALEMSAHQKRPYKKMSNQFSNLSDFQQPMMALSNALRISANGLDKKEKKVNKKIEMFKERQYSEMKSVSGNTNYMIDFMSVLQQDSNNQKSVKNTSSNQGQSSKEISSKPPKLLALTNTVSTRNNPQKNPYQSTKTSPKVLSHTNLNSVSSSPGPLSNASNFLPLTQPPHLSSTQVSAFSKQNQVSEAKIKTKTSIQQDVNIHNRVKDAIQNSKKLIMKLKQKSKKNI